MALKNRLGEMLLKAGVLTEGKLLTAYSQHQKFGGRFTRTLADLHVGDEAAIVKALSAGLGVKSVDLSSMTFDKAALARMDATFAEKHGVFPVALKENGQSLQLAMVDPSDLAVLDASALRAKARILPVLVGETDLAKAISKHYRGVELSREIEFEDYEVPTTPDGFEASGAFLLPSREEPAEDSAKVERLAKLRDNHTKSAAVLRALSELLEEKGILPRG